MPSKVGDALNYRGRQYIITSIEKRQAQTLAPEDHIEMEANMRQAVNTRFMGEVRFEPFEEGAIISINCEWCILRCGEDTQFIYTKYVVEKEQEDGNNDSAPDANEAASTTAETTNEQP